MLYLAPPLLVADLVLVLQVHNHLRLARQCPHQSPSVGRGELFRWPYLTIGAVHLRRGLIYYIHKVPNKPVHHDFIIVVFAHFEGVVEKNVGCKESNICNLWVLDGGVTSLKSQTLSKNVSIFNIVIKTQKSLCFGSNFFRNVVLFNRLKPSGNFTYHQV
jgi:hypothetical protein